jgi:hypothetical protein
MHPVVDLFEVLALFALALTCIALGASSIRAIMNGSVVSFNRVYTRVYDRRESPTGFWMSVAAGLIWGLPGFFLLWLASMWAIELL